MDSGMIDIHSHILYGVDDGAPSREVSVEMLREAGRQGVTDIIATPHYRQGMFSYPAAKIFSNYQDLRREAHRVGIRLSLGCEYFVDGDIYENLRKGRVPTLGGTGYVLTEYAPDASGAMIRTYSLGLVRQGYRPIVAHAERIQWMVSHPEEIEKFRMDGVTIHLNADSVLGRGGRSRQKFCLRLLKENMADFIASDAHDMIRRAIRLRECMEYVKKHINEECARKLFCRNGRKILRSDT